LANTKNVKGKTFEPIDLPKQQTLCFDNFYPVAGNPIEETNIHWSKYKANTDSTINLDVASNDYKLVLAAA